MIRLFDRTRRLRLLFSLLLTASIVIITIDYRSRGRDSALEQAGRIVLTVVGPIQEGLTAIGRPIGNFFAGFTQVGSLKARIDALEAENAELRAGQDEITDIVRENETLRQLLELRGRHDLQTMSAQVIGVGPSNFERILFVDRGSRDGVKEDMPVLGGAGLVGRVIDVGRSTSKILLIVDRSSSVAGRVAAAGEIGVVTGSGGSTLRLELFNPEAAVKKGDHVVTSGYDGGVYPAGLPIGTVASAPKSPAALQKIVTVTPFVDFTTLDHVLLVIGEKEARR